MPLRPPILIPILILILLTGCAAPDIPPAPASPTLTPSPSLPLAPSPTFTSTPTQTPTSTPTNTPTATVTPTATHTPSPSPTASPTSTPTPAPSSLAQARKAMRDGDYEAAIGALTAFLAALPEKAQAIEARFLLARAYLAAGQRDQAAAILEALRGDEDALARFPEILYWLGRAYLPTDPARAAQAFEAYAGRSPHLAAAIWIRAGDAWLDAGDAARATTAYTQALNLAPGVMTALHAREGLAQAALAAGDSAGAIAQYRAILQQARSPAYRAEIWYRLGQAQEAAGLIEDAWTSYHQATKAAPASGYAYQALVKLVNAQQAVDPLLRAEIDIAAGAYLPAITVLKLHLEETPGDRADKAYALLARAYEKLDDYAQSEQAWRQALALTSDEALKSDAWLGLGRSYWRRGLKEEAREVYLQAAEQSQDPDTAATALWWAAVLAGEDEAKWLQAADDFMRLARTYPQSDYAAQAGFRAGLIHYRLGDYETARALWTEHASAGRNLWHAAADFWLGKLFQAEGKDAETLDHWRGVADRWGVNNFYGVRARQKLAEAGQPLPPIDSPSDMDDDALLAWTAGLSPSANVTDFQQIPPEFAQVEEWHRIGERDRAHRELERLRLAWKDDPVRLLQLALFARDRGYYDASIRAALRLANLSGQSFIDTPRSIQELAYPTYYEDLVTSSAQRFDLDPALYFALIRQESLFWAPAASHVGAQGLTQIMPGTGRGAASQLGMTDFALSDLTRPVISLTMGAYIFSQELARGDGNVFWALAAYNAGPGNAAFWWGLAEGDEDLFVELISFRETQTYVRTITVQAEHYRRLYPELRE